MRSPCSWDPRQVPTRSAWPKKKGCTGAILESGTLAQEMGAGPIRIKNESVPPRRRVKRNRVRLEDVTYCTGPSGRRNELTYINSSRNTLRRFRRDTRPGDFPGNPIS